MNKIKNLICYLILFVGSCTQLHAEDHLQSFLYKISGNGLTEESYILGTCHTFPITYYQDSVKGFNEALHQAKHIMTEEVPSFSGDSTIYMEELKKYGDEMRFYVGKTNQYKTMPIECNYTKLYNNQQLEFIKKVFRLHLGEGGALFLGNNTPLYAWDRLCAVLNFKHKTEKAKNKSLGELCQMDANHIDIKVAHIGKTEKGYTQLDGPSTVLARIQEDSIIFSSFTMKEQADILYFYTKYLYEHPEVAPTAEESEVAYRKQDWEILAQLNKNPQHAIIYHPDILPPEISDKLIRVVRTGERYIIENRTISWIPKIEESIKKKATFICMGFAHLTGKEGSIQLLKDKGYTVEPVL